MIVIGFRILIEIIVIILTLAKTLQTYYEAIKLKIKSPFAKLLVEGGKSIRIKSHKKSSI